MTRVVRPPERRAESTVSLSRALSPALVLGLLSAPALGAGLLAGRAPMRAEGAEYPARLTDGVRDVEGAFWASPSAVVLPAGAFVEWDLGAVAEIAAVNLQADNNDDYQLLVSLDGQDFSVAWRSGLSQGAGLRLREGRGLDARARFVRLQAPEGDGSFSVSELELFSSGAAAWAAGLGDSSERPMELWWGLAALGVGAILFATGARVQRRAQGLAALAMLGLGGVVLARTLDAPVSARQLDWIRAAVAVVALLAVVRPLVWRQRHPGSRPHELGVLAAAAVLALLCFLNLGRPQFFDAGRGQQTFLHHYDMRTYFLIAKYFPELRFDGVYAASTMAVAESRGGIDAIASTGLRDLRTHQFTNAGAVREHLLEVRSRFTPERWAAFVEDAAYFRRAMGDSGFLDSQQDHGGNATPVWFLAARALFGSVAASDQALWLGVALDIGLLLLGFTAIAWAFGLRTALVGVTVFGAMDFYMFGTNWVGATLRHDWLALWAIGLAALKKERWALAGAVLAWSSMIRAFPALTFTALAVPVGWDAVGALAGRRFDRRQWLERHRGFFRVALAAATATAGLGALAAAVFGADAWLLWLGKVSLLNAGTYINNLSVKNNLVSVPAVLIAIAGTAAVIAGARKAQPHHAAAWGIFLLPLLFNPANYYLHAVFLLVVLADEGPDGARHPGVWVALLGMCFVSYFTWITGDVVTHFRLDTIVLMLTLAAIWGVLLAASLRRPPPSPAPAGQPAAAPHSPGDGGSA